MKSNKVPCVLALVFGFLGVIVCIAAILAVSSFADRLDRTNEMVFETIDSSLVAVRKRVEGAQEAIQTAKITTDDVKQGLTDLAQKEAGERVASRLQLEERTTKLARGLEQADAWLEVSDESMQSVQQILEMGRSLGAPLDAEFVDPLLEKIQSLRLSIKNTTEFVDDVGQTAADLREGEPVKQRIEKAVQLIAKVVLTLSEMDSRLVESAERLTEMQQDGQQLKARTHWYIVLAKLISYLLITWMAVGQVFMCRYGAKHLRQADGKASG